VCNPGAGESFDTLGGADSVTVSSGTVTSIAEGSGSDTYNHSGGGTVSTVDQGSSSDIANVGTGASIGTLLQGSGDDTLTMTGGSITSVDQGSFGDILNLSGGTIGTVDQNTGTDSMTVSGGSVTGAVLQDDAVDTFVMSAGQIGSLDQGNDFDDAFISGGTILGLFENGDLVEFSGGTIDDVNLQAADNVFSMWGSAAVTQNLNSEQGTDSYSLFGGTIGGTISTGSNDDTLTIGGTPTEFNGVPIVGVFGATQIQTDVIMEGGNDNVTMNGGSIGGSLYLDAGPGHSNARPSDGFDDTATLNGGTVVGSIITDATADGQVGNDVVTVNGATVGGSIETEGGSDAIDLRGGASVAGGVMAGADDDTVSLNDSVVRPGGVVFDGGADTDILRFAANGNASAPPGQFVNFEELDKLGVGALTLHGAQTFADSANILSGSLIVAGQLTSATTTVAPGARLETRGGSFVGDVVNRGTFSPGGDNAIETTTITGDLTHAGTGTFVVNANPTTADRVNVRGTVTIRGGKLQVAATNGNYKTNTDYVIINNDGTDAVAGAFASVTSNLAFLVPAVFYNRGTGNDVVLHLERNEIGFCSVTNTTNQCSVATALDKFPTGNPLFLAVLNQTANGARQAFDALSGEVHATVAGTLSDDSRYVREAVLGRLMQASHTNGALSAGGPQVASYDSQAMMLGSASMYDGKSLVDEPGPTPLAFWTRAFGAWGDFDSDGNAASADRDLGGFISGMDADIGASWRAGLATGASFSNVSVDDRYSSADVETYHLGGYLGGMAGPLALRGGGMWAWSDIDTSRAVVFPGFFERQKASYDADTGQLFGEVAYPTQTGGIALEPFGGLAFVSVDTDSFRERGGAQASLRGVNVDQDVGYTTLGLRAATTMMWGATQVTPHISAAWLHAFDDVTPGASLAFATTGIGFAIDGVPLAEDSALLDAGLDFALGDRMTAGVSYTGQYSDGVTDNGVKGRFTWLF